MSFELKRLLTSFEDWILFSSTLNELDEEIWNSSLEPGKWTIKDIICHIMLWDKYFYEEAIEKIALGKKVTLQHLDYDEFNHNAIIYARTIEPNELIEKAKYYRQKIIEDIRSLSKKAVEEKYIDGDGNVFHIPQYLKDFIWHDQHHVIPLKIYLKQLK